MNGETKPIWESQTAFAGLLGMGLLDLANVFGALPDKLIWPLTAIVVAVIAARACADFGKYAQPKV